MLDDTLTAFRTDDRKVAEAARILKLDELLSRKPKALSGGQRQRVAMGRALARDPTLFLFDEPLSNLDAKLRVEMRAELKLLHQKTAITTVYVTHDQVEAMTLGDRIAVMKDGLVRAETLPLVFRALGAEGLNEKPEYKDRAARSKNRQLPNLQQHHKQNTAPKGS